MHADLEAARELLRQQEPHWAVIEVRGEQARVAAALALPALYAALQSSLGETWGLGWGVEASAPYLVRCRLRLLGEDREALATAPALADAQALAAAEAARAWGLMPEAPGAHWVEYDPEEGPNTAELEAPEGPAPSPSAPRPEPETVLDPQLVRARQHIDDLLEGLKAAGLGGQAARVLARRGYGNTLEESREVYRELKTLQSAH